MLTGLAHPRLRVTLLIGLPIVLALAVLVGALYGRPASVPAVLAEPRDPYQALLARSTDMGSLAPSQRVSFLADLRDPSGGRDAAALAAIYDPRSAAFGHYETAQQWARRSGLARRAALQARAYLRHAGIDTAWQPGSDWVEISGPVRAIERVFRVSIRDYTSHSGLRYYAAGRDPIIPARLAGVLAGAGHISSYPDRLPGIIPATGLRPSDLLAAYDLKPLRARHFDGSGQTIAFIEIDGYHQGDLDEFTQHFNLPSMHPSRGGGLPILKVEGETELDLEVAHEIAPGARLVVYNCSTPCTNSHFASLESQAVQSTAHGIINISLGGCETAEGSATVKAENNVFSQADALGISVLVSSGDSGAYTCLQQDWSASPSPKYVGVSSPASSPSVTAVGGTSLNLHANSTWYREQAWQNPSATVATGGGVSQYFARPSWQRGPGVQSAGAQGNNRRLVPDISAEADPLTGAQVVIQGKLVHAGGTSEAAPIWAGMMALINQYLQKQGRPVAGFLNPALYALAAGSPAYPPLHDVTQGTNLLDPATPGYDMATGLGTPDAWNLARDLAAYEGGQR